MKEFKNIGHLVRKSRLKVDKLSQSLLAQKLEYKNGQFISNVERSLCSVPVKLIPKLAEELKIKKEDIAKAMIADYTEHLNASIFPQQKENTYDGINKDRTRLHCDVYTTN